MSTETVSSVLNGFVWRIDVFATLIDTSSSFLQDQFDNLEKHTQWGIEYLEKYTKFVKERSEIETNYAKQIRWVLKRAVDLYLGLLGCNWGGNVHPGGFNKETSLSLQMTYWSVLETRDWILISVLCNWPWPLASLWEGKGETEMRIPIRGLAH